jgi:hypothetical protein
MHPFKVASWTPAQEHVALRLRPSEPALAVQVNEVPVIPRCLAVARQHAGLVIAVEWLTILST